MKTLNLPIKRNLSAVNSLSHPPPRHGNIYEVHVYSSQSLPYILKMAVNSLYFRQFCCRSPARVFVTVFLVLIIIGNWLLTNRSPNSELFLSHSTIKHRKRPLVNIENTSRSRKKNYLHKNNFIPFSHSEPADVEVADDNGMTQKLTELHSSDFSVGEHVAEPEDRMGDLNDEGEQNMEVEVEKNEEILNKISEEKERKDDMATGSSLTHKSKTGHE